MSTLTLTKTETRTLTEAAGQPDGKVVLSDGMKEVTARRLLGKLLKHELVEAIADGHILTSAGYRAVGLEAPRAAVLEESAPRRTRGAMILDLLGREDGASLSELMEATGWLPHTTRAALSRIRSGGQALAKSKRGDGVTVYRIVPDEPEPARKPRRKRNNAAVQATA